MSRSSRACGQRPRPVPMGNGCGLPVNNGCGMPMAMAAPMPMNGCNPALPVQQAPAVGRVTNCPEVVQTVIEPAVVCPPDIYNHFMRTEHIVPVQRTTVHVHHNQHDFIVQEQITVDNVTERHMGPTQTITNTVQGPSVDMGWVNNFNQTPLTPLQAANLGPVVNNNVGFGGFNGVNQFGVGQQVPFVGNSVGVVPGQLGVPGVIPGLPGGFVR